PAQAIARATRDRHDLAAGEHRFPLTAALTNLDDPMAVDDRLAVHADEALGIEPRLERLQRLAVQHDLAVDVELDVVVRGGDPLARVERDVAHATAVAHGAAL